MGLDDQGANPLCLSLELLFLVPEPPVVVLSLTVEWGVGMERQGPSYGEVVSTKDVRVHALLGRSNSPTSRSPEAVEWIMSI